MGSIAEIVISFLNLLEAEGKAFRLNVTRLGLALTLVTLVGALLLAGMGLITWAVFLYLRLALSPATAALLDGLIMLLLAGMVAWLTSKLVH